MAKKRHRSRPRRKSTSSHRRRRSNPFGFSASGKHHKRHQRRRSRNPMGFGDIGSQLIWGTAGGVASLALPGIVASSWNTGITGYGLNAATAWVGKMLISRFAGPKAGNDFFVGGLVATGLRIFNNLFGSSFSVGLNGMDFYIPNSFPLPTTGQGPFLLNSGFEGGSPMASVAAGATPAAVAAAAALPAGQGTDEPTRWGKWTA